ncbi:MAG: hemolysin III family protein [Myxococcota bacterium]|nr:hemolysin III family protein [Myxococcota bacterium]
MSMDLPAVVKVKPRLRGVSHQMAFVAATFAGALLIAATPAGVARFSVTVFAVSLIWLLGVSALYHRPMWREDIRAWLKRLDHASIFLLIAGTYTPFCLLVLQPQQGHVLLGFVWAGAALGIVMVLLWPNRPRVLSAAVYVGLGVSALAYIRPIFAALDGASFSLFALGGVFYISGAVIYALRRPNPNPAVFGYHEVFHVFVVIACTMHFAAIVRVVGGAAP